MVKENEKELNRLFFEIRNNNKENFEELYNKYKALVYKIAFHILKNKEDSEDIVQNVFSKIYALPEEKLPTKNTYSWMYSVTKNEAITLFRKKKNTVNIDNIYTIETDGEINNAIDKEAFNKLISKLNDKEKEIVSLKILSGLSFSEISKLLKMPVGTIKWKYYKSMHTLKMLLSNVGMFVITFVIGLKVIVTSKTNNKTNSTNEANTENQTNSTNNRIEEDEQYADTTYLREHDNQYIEKQNDAIIETKEETQVPNIEAETNINYYGIGMLAISSVFLILSIVLFINFIKNQLKRNKKASK